MHVHYPTLLYSRRRRDGHDLSRPRLDRHDRAGLHLHLRLLHIHVRGDTSRAIIVSAVSCPKRKRLSRQLPQEVQYLAVCVPQLDPADAQAVADDCRECAFQALAPGL
jgi:hypothetical protein